MADETATQDQVRPSDVLVELSEAVSDLQGPPLRIIIEHANDYHYMCRIYMDETDEYESRPVIFGQSSPDA